MRRRLPILRLVLAFPACSAGYLARVIGIADGDTITVLTADRTQHSIRLWGIDAPETGQDFGGRANQAASTLAFGQQVTIRARDTDRYGRTVDEVILPDGRSLNQEMVRQGMAWRYRRYAPHDAELARLEFAGENRPDRAVEPAEPGASLELAAWRGHPAGSGCRGKSPEPRISQTQLPGRGGDEREEPRDVRQRGGRGEGGISEGERLLVTKRIAFG
jgi:hypothetical protein